MFTFKSKHSSDYKPMSFPAGYYRGVIGSCFSDYSKSSGQEMLVARIIIRSADGAQELELTHYMPISVEWKLEQFCVACGLTFGSNEDVSFNPSSMVGKHVTVRTHMEPGSNDPSRLFAHISALMPRGAEPHLGPMTPEELAANGLQEDGRIAPRKPRNTNQSHSQNGTPQQARQNYGQEQPYRQPELEDDDIPF